MTPDQVRHEAGSGRWVRMARGVYRIAGAPQTWRQSAVAACRSGPPGTVASHLTAAALFDLCAPPVLPHVTIPRGTSGRTRLARVHWAILPTVDVTTIGRIPVVRPARIAVDAAELLGAGDRLDELLDTLHCRGLVTHEAVRAAYARASARPGRKGGRALMASLAESEGQGVADSVPEVRLFRRVVRWGFPRPVRQFEIRAPDGRLLGIPDMSWPPWFTGLEYDGAIAHAPRRWASDEAREEAIERYGWRLVRADADDLRPSATRVRDELAALLPIDLPTEGAA
jgi:hypothetical protein